MFRYRSKINPNEEEKHNLLILNRLVSLSPYFPTYPFSTHHSQAPLLLNNPTLLHPGPTLADSYLHLYLH